MRIELDDNEIARFCRNTGPRLGRQTLDPSRNSSSLGSQTKVAFATISITGTFRTHYFPAMEHLAKVNIILNDVGFI